MLRCSIAVDTSMGNGKSRDDASVVATGAQPAVRLDALRSLVLRQVRIHKTLIKFMLVGLLGYALYTATLLLAYDAPLPFMPSKHTSVQLGPFTHSDLRLLIGTLLAAQVSITGGFFARDRWVFTDRPVVHRPGWMRMLHYQAKSLVSTLGIVTVTVNVLTLEVGIPYYIATPIGVGVAFIWNWLWESQFIWRRNSPA